MYTAGYIMDQYPSARLRRRRQGYKGLYLRMYIITTGCMRGRECKCFGNIKLLQVIDKCEAEFYTF